MKGQYKSYVNGMDINYTYGNSTKYYETNM